MVSIKIFIFNCHIFIPQCAQNGIGMKNSFTHSVAEVSNPFFEPSALKVAASKVYSGQSEVGVSDEMRVDGS